MLKSIALTYIVCYYKHRCLGYCTSINSVYMLKLDFTKAELKEVLNKTYFSGVQERIIVYRMRDLSIIQMADLEHCSPSKINSEIRKIRLKLEKIN